MIPFAGDIIKPVAKQDTEGIDALFQLAGDIKRYIEGFLVISDPAGVEEVITRCFPIAGEVEVSQPADKDRRSFYGFTNFEFLAE